MKQRKLAKILFISGLSMLAVSLVLTVLFMRSQNKTDNATIQQPVTVETDIDDGIDDISPAEQVILARDAERMLDIDALAVALDAYFVTHGNYPNIQDMNSEEFRSKRLSGLDAEVFSDPQDKDDFSYIAGGPQSNLYAYDVRTETGASCDNGDLVPCTRYILTAKLEAGDPYVKKSK